jgi:hypothetical protein
VKRLPSDNDSVISINKRLDAIISILLNPAKFQESTLKEKIVYLNSLKFDNYEIANLLNTTESLVAKEKSLAKKGKIHD